MSNGLYNYLNGYSRKVRVILFFNVTSDRRKRPQVPRRLDRKNFSTERVEQDVQASGENPARI